jgi:flagellar hook-associated protein 3 FlgL
MDNRISTASAYNSILTNLMNAQVAQAKAGNQISSSETATDLEGYGTGAETLTALQSTATQVTGYLNNTQMVSAKLSTQDNALTEVASSADSALQSVTQALASGNGTTLMASLQASFSNAVDGLNSTFNGEYLFSGGQVNTQAVSAASLSDLTANPIASLFHNDQRVTSTQLDANTSVSTGFLASDVGTPLFQALAAIEAYNQGPGGPISGNLTTAQATFLTSQISGLDTVESNLNNVAAQNGQAQNVVTNAQTDLTQRQTMLQNLVGNITSADLAQATTNLQQAQLSIQAAGQVFQALNSASLLNSLSVTPAIG